MCNYFDMTLGKPLRYICVFSLFLTSLSLMAQQEKIDSLESVLNQSTSQEEKLRLYVQVVDIYDNELPSEQGIQRAIEGLELANKLKDDFSRARLLRMRGQLHNELYQNEYERSLEYFSESLKVSRKLQKAGQVGVDHQKEMASALNSIAYLYWQWGKLAQSQVYYDSAIVLSTKIWQQDSTFEPNIRLLGLEHNSKGAVLWGMGKYDEAISHYFSAIQYFERLDMKKHLCLTNSNIGLIYDSWGQKEEAVFYFRRSVVLGLVSDDPTAIGYALSNMGRFKETAGEYDSALYYYQRSSSKYLEAENEWGIGLNLIGTGRMYVKMGDFDRSLKAFDQALHRAETNKANYWIAQAKYNISKTLAARGDYDKALQYARETNVLAQEHGYNEILKDSYLNVSEIYERLSDYRQALLNFQQYAQLRDSLFSEERFKQITLMKEQFETEKREKENDILRRERLMQEQDLQQSSIEKVGLGILLLVSTVFAIYFVISTGKFKKVNTELNQKNQEITRQKEELDIQAIELKKSNEIKNLMFSIVSHDLRGPIVNVGNLVTMLDSDVLTQHELKQMLPSVAANIGNITNLTDNLLYWAKSQMDGIKVDPHVFDLCEHMSTKIPLFEKVASDKGIKLHNRLSPGTLIYADAYMVELVVRNLVSNSIKFCLAGNSITVSSKKDQNTTTVTVKDTGQGIPPENLHRIFTDIQFTTLGTSNEKGVGLGLMMCKHFVELNGGKIWVESVFKKGSSFHFSLPVRPPSAAQSTHDAVIA